MDSIFGYFSLFAGLYCLVGFYKLKFKKEVTESLMIKGQDIRKCKDYQGYCKAMEIPMLILALILVVCGGVDLFHARTGQAMMLNTLMIPAAFGGLIYYSVSVRKANEKYFE